MTDDEIGWIESRLSKITPGTWVASVEERIPGTNRNYGLGVITPAPDRLVTSLDFRGIFTSADANFISEAPADMRALLDEVKRLRAQVEWLVKEIEAIENRMTEPIGFPWQEWAALSVDTNSADSDESDD